MKKAYRIVVITCLSLFTLFFSALGAFFLVTNDVKLDENKLIFSQNNVVFYDKNGKEIEEVSAKTHKQNVSLDELKSYTKEAFLSIEDKDFYRHSGINTKRILKATMKNLKSKSFSEGASTISQQLIKNTHLSNEKTMLRKLQEIRLSFALERAYTKDEILECYLNTVYFGHSAFGIGEASYFYFGKHPSTLTVGESALLAGLLQSPNRYSPFHSIEKCKARREIVLNEMKKDGIISPSEWQEARNEEIPVLKHERGHRAYFELVFEELDELAEEHDFLINSLHVFTNLNPEIEKEIEVKTDSDITIEVTNKEKNAIEGFYSTVGNIERLPGSIIKPLLVYAPCIEEKLISPATAILDEKTAFGDYKPQNYQNEYRGYMSVREALKTSANIPAVKLLNELGIEKGVRYLGKMGLDAKDDQSLALALGGMKHGFRLKDLIDAYSVFLNEGEYVKYHAIDRIEDEKGKLLCQTKYEKTHVFSKETTSLMNDMLRSVVTEGTAKKLKNLPFPVYAKTGTVGTEKGNTDAYTIAFTNQYTVGVWLGNADYSPFEETGGGKPCLITSRIIEKICEENTPKELPIKGKIKRISLDKMAYQTKHELLLADPKAPKNETFTELFLDCMKPKKQSNYFSNPSIQTPQISVENGIVVIRIPSQKYYSYRVDRLNYTKYTTIYSNIQSLYISDSSVQDGETYTYFVTPLYQNNEGERIPLPSVHIPKISQTESPFEPPQIIKKDWWNL